jgi:hypothetical protein
MHEPFEPKCTFCAKFVRCFADDSPLAEWGYCAEARQGAVSNRKALARLEKEAQFGNYRRLLEDASALGLYQETDDGCERFAARMAAPAIRRSRGGSSHGRDTAPSPGVRAGK